MWKFGLEEIGNLLEIGGNCGNCQKLWGNCPEIAAMEMEIANCQKITENCTVFDEEEFDEFAEDPNAVIGSETALWKRLRPSIEVRINMVDGLVEDGCQMNFDS